MAKYSTYMFLLSEWGEVFDSEAGFHPLMDHYDGAHDRERHYHTAEHIAATLNGLLEVSDRSLIRSDININMVKAALFFHDAIYFIERSGNECRSADLYRDFVKMFKGVWAAPMRRPFTTTKVRGAIEATWLLGPRPQGSPDLSLEAELVCDLDLLFLGQESSNFRGIVKYEDQIWQEYVEMKRSISSPPEEKEYLPKRLDVVRKLYDLAVEGTLYKTPGIQSMYGKQAVINLTHLLGILAGRNSTLNR